MGELSKQCEGWGGGSKVNVESAMQSLGTLSL